MRTHKWFVITVVVVSCQFASAGYAASPWQNPTLPGDVNGDGRVTPFDALAITNALNNVGSHALTASDTVPPYVDVNGDGNLSPMDMLVLTNCLNNSDCPKSGGGGGTPSGGGGTSSDGPTPRQAEGEAQGAPPPVLITPTLTPTPTPTPPPDACTQTTFNCEQSGLCPANPNDPALAWASNYELIRFCLDRGCCPTPTPTPQPQFCCWNREGAYCTSSPQYGPFPPGYGCSSEPVDRCSDCRAPETPTPTPTPAKIYCCWTPRYTTCVDQLIYGPWPLGYGCSSEPLNSCGDCRPPETPTPTPTPQPQFCCWNPQGAYCTSSPVYGPSAPGYGCDTQPVADCSACQKKITPTPTPTPTPVIQRSQSCIWVAGWAQCSGNLLMDRSGNVYGCAAQKDSYPADWYLQAEASKYTYQELQAIPNCFGQHWTNCDRTLQESPFLAQYKQSGAVKFWSGCRGPDYVGVGPVDLANFLGVPDHAANSPWEAYRQKILTGTSANPETDQTAVRNYLQQKGYSYTDFINDTLPPSIESDMANELHVGYRCFSGDASLTKTPECYLPAPLSGSWFMDANCHVVESGPDTKLCGFAGVSWSPISLLWEEAPLTEGMTIVPFSLTPQVPDAYTLWKASGKAPLLVYDPRKTGQVTSARQLFGHFAFGGKTDKLSGDFMAGALREPWDNGYDALELLDADRNGTISGKELDALSLWFDRNRDGRVQPGEMVTVKKAGVTALYYKAETRDPATGDLFVARGYERRVGGTTVTGRSVDWYSPTFKSKQEALQALSALFKRPAEQDAAAGATSFNAPQEPLRFAPHRSMDHARDISGYWLWWTNDKDTQKKPNVFAFEQGPGGELHGFNVVETDLAPNPERLRSAMLILPAAGALSAQPDGTLQLTMEMRDGASGGIAKSTATLSADGGMLRGKTTQTYLQGASDKAPQSVTVDYEWTARKMAEPSGK